VGSPQMNFIDGSMINDTLVLDDIPIQLTPQQLAVIGPSRRSLIVGIRPENMIDPNGKIRIGVKVDMSEMLGSEKIAYFYIGKNRCSVKLPPTFSVDEDMILKIDSETMFLFDEVTGERLDNPAPPLANKPQLF